ncbi:MAG: hypothetical protein ABSA93_21285 [Streptosporangiaceae bacterium]|jgi:predicted membrane channel-forming protein YqfA (hemolysin III family)
MSLFVSVLAWIIIAAGTAGVARQLLALAGGGRGRRARQESWQWLRFSLFVVSGGLFLLESLWREDAARWLVLIAAGVVTAWDRVLWLRSRMRSWSH